MVLLVNNTLYVANVGDSKAIVCRQQPKHNNTGSDSTPAQGQESSPLKSGVSDSGGDSVKITKEDIKNDSGDSKCDVGGGKDSCKDSEAEKKKFVGLTLTKDHNPTQYEERMRIQKAGGQVR